MILLCSHKLKLRLPIPGASAEAFLHACMTEAAKEHGVCWVTTDRQVCRQWQIGKWRVASANPGNPLLAPSPIPFPVCGGSGAGVAQDTSDGLGP